MSILECSLDLVKASHTQGFLLVNDVPSWFKGHKGKPSCFMGTLKGELNPV